MANRNFANGGKIFSMNVAPVLITCNFVVDSANGNGLGIRSLKAPTVANVFMHTSASPAVGNPNPESGIIVVQFQDNYRAYLGGFSGFVSPITSISGSVIAGNAYVLTSPGSASAAQLIAAGIPSGVVAGAAASAAGLSSLIGVSFISAASGTLAGSATAGSPSSSGIDHIEVVGDPNLIFQSTPQGQGQLILQCLLNSSLTAPADGTVIGLSFIMNNSSVSTG